MAFSADVLIIGAGMAGLAAAGHLSRAGVNVRLLEARNRTGGRVFTMHEPDLALPIELGAEFVHGKPPEIWDLLRHAGAPVDEVTGRDFCIRDDAAVRPCDFFDPVDDFLQRMTITSPDMSFRQFADSYAEVSPKVKQQATRYVEGFNAAHAEEISVNSLVRARCAEEQIEGDRVFRIRDGYSMLARILLADCDPRHLRINMGAAVKTVDWKSGSITAHAFVAGKPKSFRARRAVITLPLGVLQAPPGSTAAVEFNPPLHEKQDALSCLAMGHVIRITLRFHERFWDETPMADMRFLFTEDETFPTWWTSMPVPERVITAWASATAAEQLSRLTQEQIRIRAVETLATALKTPLPKVAGLLEHAYMHNWQTDPFAHGSYSYIKVGGDNAPQQLAEPVAGTLFFAGEASETEGHHGTVHGAIATGLRAARQLLADAGRVAA